MWDGVERMDESFVSRPNLKKKVALPKGLVVAFNLPTHAHYDTHSLGALATDSVV